ncbi:ATP-binding protein [Clostridium sp. ZBS2]|uniref:ATP-binding protein n=1 Tax=Clostridium sp. ZBS2 TaxID=2949976 RepID=UPI00207AC12A|nr:ATP-binding protein [Clostridium sp. ZBS2]
MNSVNVNLNNQKIEEILGLVASPSIVLSELVKNGFDSNATKVIIDINTNNNEIIIKDDGDGLLKEEIEELGNIGSSMKKENNNIKRKDGKYLAGSKGLGLLSSFTLSNYIEISTTNEDESYLVKWKKSQGEFTYEKIEKLNEKGTKLIMKNISDGDIVLLTDEEEYKKLRHMTIDHFKNNTSNLIVHFLIDNKEVSNFECCDYRDIDNAFIYKISFKYNSKNNTLEYKYGRAKINLISEKTKIYNNPTDRLYKGIHINLKNNINMNDIIKKSYNINNVQVKKNYEFKYLSTDLEDFDGEFWVTHNSKPKDSKKLVDKFGYGVKVFVNGYAMYSYLDNEKDWLSFSQLSQLKKSTTLKLHNVFGYINFEDFNEKTSNLKIANERANFIEQAPYKKFLEIMNQIVVKIAFEVDVAYRNNNIDKSNYYEEIVEELKENKESEDNKKKKENKKIGDKKELEYTSKRKKLEDNKGRGEIKEIEDKKGLEDTKRSKEPEESKEIKEKIKVEDDNNNNFMEMEKKPKKSFFNTSKVLKLEIPINLEYNEIISALSSLKYDKYYCLYVISFRAILEDLAKRYLNFRAIPINGDLGKNIKNMAEDMLNICRDNTKISKSNKEYIENMLGGFNAFKGFLESIQNEFHCGGKPGHKANKLNSLVHNPRFISIDEAEEIANDTILPLLLISQEIKNRIIK